MFTLMAQRDKLSVLKQNQEVNMMYGSESKFSSNLSLSLFMILVFGSPISAELV